LPLEKRMRNKLAIAIIVALIAIPASVYLIYFLPGFNDLLLTDPYSYWISFGTAIAWAFIIGVLLRLIVDMRKS
jgi:hypothetical protein